MFLLYFGLMTSGASGTIGGAQMGQTEHMWGTSRTNGNIGKIFESDGIKKQKKKLKKLKISIKELIAALFFTVLFFFGPFYDTAADCYLCTTGSGCSHCKRVGVYYFVRSISHFLYLLF